jgi:5-methylcytosine-specific restriction endonuclease McrA
MNTTFIRRKAAGLCRDCSTPVFTGKLRCTKCQGEHFRKKKEREQRYIQSGLCKCGRELEDGFKSCKACREKSRVNAQKASSAGNSMMHKWRNAGLCIECGKTPRTDKKTCQACADDKRALYVKHRINGQCVECKLPAIYSGYCEDHWFRMMSHNALKEGRFSGAIRQLWNKQQGRCAYMGAPLIPGETASLDHIIPRSRGGSDTIENLEWVSLEVNLAKRNKTREEYLAQCRQVIEYQAEKELNRA